MKLILFLTTITLIIYNIAIASTPDTLILQTKRIKGFGKLGMGVSPLATMSNENSWYSTIPKIKNIPTNLERLMFTTLEMDFLQHTYQNYYLGNISEERFLDLQKSWKWYPDSMKYTKTFVKVNVAIAAGVNKEGEILVYVDRNNNYDLCDDIPLKLPPKLPGQNFWGRYNDNLPIEVEFEYFDGKDILKSKTWLYIDYSVSQYTLPDSIANNQPIKLSVGFAEHRLAEIAKDGNSHKIGVTNIRAVFRDGCKLMVLSDEQIQDSYPDRVNLGELVKLANEHYRFSDISIDGQYITLIKERDVY